MKRTSKIRVLSYNIHQGLTVYRRQIALSLLKEAIKSLRADIVLLQEVAGVQGPRRKKDRVKDSENISPFQLEALVDDIWPYHAYGRNAVFSGGFHGNAILSKFPIVKSRNIDISLKNMLRRGMLHAEIAISEGAPLQVIATHLGLLQYERQKQVRLLCQYAQKNIPAGEPFLLGGDFNDWREKISGRLSRSLKMDEAFLKTYKKHARTFPSRLPVLRLDRIYFRQLRLHSATRLWGRPWLLLSDHLPLLAEFSLESP